VRSDYAADTMEEPVRSPAYLCDRMWTAAASKAPIPLSPSPLPLPASSPELLPVIPPDVATSPPPYEGLSPSAARSHSPSNRSPSNRSPSSRSPSNRSPSSRSPSSRSPSSRSASRRQRLAQLPSIPIECVSAAASAKVDDLLHTREQITLLWSAGQYERAYALGWTGEWECSGGSLTPKVRQHVPPLPCETSVRTAPSPGSVPGSCSPASIIAQGTILSGQHGVRTQQRGSKRALQCAVASGCVAVIALAALIVVLILFFSS
jgi:hypothetical protein